MARLIVKSFDELYEGVKGDKTDFINVIQFQQKIDDLIDIGYVCIAVVNDCPLYLAKHGLKWADFVDLEDSIQKSALLLLIENPTTFFVLLNTQKGKMRIAAEEIKIWGQDNTKKVVSFIIVDNDKTLCDQSADGIKKTFGEKIKMFPLSSNTKTTFDDIKIYIDAYAADKFGGEYFMPLIILLCNNKQVEKMLKLIHHITKKVIQDNSILRYGIIWDEADKTYSSQLRTKPFTIDGTSIMCKTFTVDNTIALYRLGFVTATDGNLLDEEYPECANAFLYPVDISPEDEQHYRALHHAESITHRVPFKPTDTNNVYAKQILEKNSDYFKTPITLSSGEIYFRKVIVNSNAKTEDMDTFAKECNKMGMYALVFNGYGGASVKVFKDGISVGNYKTKGMRLNERLFYIYKKLNLHIKPLVIIGRRKVDRGLGFHYCPRTDTEITIDGLHGELKSKNKEGLVWTDIILGKIEDKDTAVQKAGRGAGIIGNSPQYSGSTHYWTDENTEQLIRRHNTIVDKTNITECYSVRQAVNHAKSITPEVKKNVHIDNRTTVPIVFSITSIEYASIHKIGNSWDVESIFNIIKNYNAELLTTLKPLTQIQITESTEENPTYVKRITNFVNAAKNNKKVTLGTGKITKDSYQIFLDKLQNRIIISIFYGSK